jgi:hypothetical protein
MKAKTMRHAVKAGLFLFVILATCGFAGTANAQTTLVGSFKLPFQVHWGKSALPAGQYTVSMDGVGPVATVRSANGKIAFFTPIPIRAYSEKGAAALVVMVRGNERIVRSLNLPDRHISLIYQPATEAQRELLAQADHIQAVPVITAGK